jgi:hypothetical protein
LQSEKTMPRILAIDWDRLEARALVVHVGPTGTSVAGAWAASLTSAEGAAPTAKQIGAQLALLIAGAAAGNVTTLVGVGRDQVQMVRLSLPPAPPEELPDLVRFQAEREFTSLGADASLDFIPLSGDATTPHEVLAAALAGAGIAEVSEVCQTIGVEPQRITLRATAAASFVARRIAAGASDVSLVVNRLTDEADLAVLVGDQVVLVRTVRLSDSSDEPARGRALSGEIRRTVASARQQLGEQIVGRVVLCGNASEAGEAAALTAELGLPVELFDVADNAPSGLARAGVSRDSLARFAAVLGMALGEADRRPPVVDFLNVRKRVEPRRVTRTHMIAAGVAAAAVLLFGLILWQRSASLGRELRRLNAETAQLDAQFKENEFDQSIDQAAAIERWLATDVHWLDELHRLSRQWRPEPLDSKAFPAGNDVVVTQLTAFRPPGNAARGGRLAIQAVARDQAAVATLEDRLRDTVHGVSTGGGKQDSTVPGYAWSFPLTIDVAPADDAGRVAP